MPNIERRVLVLIVDPCRVLLATATHLMGPAVGKIVAPNGLVHDKDVFESARRCAVEQIGIGKLVAPEKVAVKQYDCTNGKQVVVDVVQAGYEGLPGNTKWLVGPCWKRFDRLPYELMFKDDRDWLPNVLQGERGRYRFKSNGPDDNRIVERAPLYQVPVPAS